MIKLINGRGQLGTALEKLIKNRNPIRKDVMIYHTWNFLDKSETTQEDCYHKFKKFVDDNLNSKIIFISTYATAKNPYTFYKRLSEGYLLHEQKNGMVIQLPNLIGKGICEKFRNEEVEPFGMMEVITIEDSAKIILDFTSFESPIQKFRVKGTLMPAELVQKLILYGRDGK